ncbi:WD40 repeat-like protein, partial [Pluteus cervinus]
ILSLQLKFNLCNQNTSYEKNTEIQNMNLRVGSCISCELQYSSQYWIHHLLQSSPCYDPSSDQILSKMLINLTTIYWIECLSLLWKVSSSLVYLQHLQRVSPYSSYVQDLYNFITKFYIPIQESAPHLYLSALPFTPRQSIIYERCSVQLHKRIEVVNNPDFWDMKNFSISTDDVTCIMFHSQKHIIYSGTIGAIISWSGYNGLSVGCSLKAQMISVSALAISYNRDILYSGCNTVKTWDLSTGQQVGQPVYSEFGITALVHFPKSSLVATGFSNFGLVIWNIQTGKQVFGPFTCHTSSIQSISIFPDSKQIITGGKDGTLRIWKTD